MTSPIERKPSNDKTIMPLRGEGNQNRIAKEIERVKAIYKKYGLNDQTDEFWLDLATENLRFRTV